MTLIIAGGRGRDESPARGQGRADSKIPLLVKILPRPYKELLGEEIIPTPTQTRPE